MSELYKRPMGEILVAQGIITRDQLDEALAEQKRSFEKLGKVLCDLGFVTEERITEAMAAQIDVSYVNLQDHKFDQEVVSLVPEGLARSYRLIPAKRVGDKLVVAMANPLDVEATDLVQVHTKLRLEPALATEWRIMECIERNYGSYCTEELQNSVQEAASNVEVASVGIVDRDESEETEDINEVFRQVQRAPIVRMVNLLLTEAARKKASDIHIEPRRNVVDVRFRIDGDLRVVRHIPRSLHNAVSSRIKVMAELDIAERRLPQDGRLTVRIDTKNIDVRVSTTPSMYGERVVLRILDRSSSMIPLDRFGYSARELDLLKSLITRPQGIVLVTGPTGSGKTTTLYGALNSLRSERVNIMTVEDPIEYELDGINQTNVHHRIGLTFANQLRSILRQDPDIVLVGEIRDTETADVAFRAAMTGHLVLSTLHCNDAPSAIARLLDMDIEPFLVSSAINGVVAQRLVRVLCPDCKMPYTPDEETREVLGLSALDDITLYHPAGCGSCDGTGYRGRTCVSEIMVMSKDIRRLCMSRTSGDVIAEAAIANGMTTMRDDAVNKVLAGVTTVEEVQRKVFFDPEVDIRMPLRQAA